MAKAGTLLLRKSLFLLLAPARAYFKRKLIIITIAITDVLFLFDSQITY